MPLNFKAPVAPILCDVGSNSNKTIINLTKLDPNLPWGEFEWNFRVMERNKVSYIATYPSQGGNAMTGYPDMGDYNDANMYGFDDIGVAAADQEKDCPVCTYKNPANLTKCDMCGSDL